jgi:hypothetical protein
MKTIKKPRSDEAVRGLVAWFVLGMCLDRHHGFPFVPKGKKVKIKQGKSGESLIHGGKHVAKTRSRVKGFFGPGTQRHVILGVWQENDLLCRSLCRIYTGLTAATGTGDSLHVGMRCYSS